MKNTSKKVIVYDPYLDTLGGGEKYILSIAQIFDRLGFEVDLVWKNPSIIEDLKTRLNISFNHVRIIPAIAHTQSYEYLFYVTDGSYFVSFAKHNYIYAMVPNKQLYGQSLTNKLKLHNYNYIVHSQFCKDIIDKWIPKKSQLLYPFVDDSYLASSSQKKEKIILSVGRFFKQLHSKRHDKAIQTFLKLKQEKNYSDYKLVLMGGLKKEDEPYYNELVKLAHNDPSILFLPNQSYKNVQNYFLKSEYYWLFTGYGEEDTQNPMAVEHFGITPLEAMASGCITFSYNAGGPKEVINNGKTGFLFNSIDELIIQMKDMASNLLLRKSIRQEAYQDVMTKFSYNSFKSKAIDLFSL